MSRKTTVYATKSQKLIYYCARQLTNTSMGVPCVINDTLYWISTYVNEDHDYLLYTEHGPHGDKVIGLITMRIKNVYYTNNLEAKFTSIDFENCSGSEIIDAINLYIKVKASAHKKISYIRIDSDCPYFDVLTDGQNVKMVKGEAIIIV